MEDPLSRALREAPETFSSDLLLARTTRLPATQQQGVHEILETLRSQVVEVLSVPFFDGGILAKTDPVTKSGRSEAGTFRVRARRNDPPYRADLVVYVRSDLELEAGCAQYQAQGSCELTYEGALGAIKRDLPVLPAVDSDGRLQMNAELLRSALASAIKSIGRVHSVDRGQ